MNKEDMMLRLRLRLRVENNHRCCCCCSLLIFFVAPLRLSFVLSTTISLIDERWVTGQI